MCSTLGEHMWERLISLRMIARGNAVKASELVLSPRGRLPRIDNGFRGRGSDVQLKDPSTDSNAWLRQFDLILASVFPLASKNRDIAFLLSPSESVPKQTPDCAARQPCHPFLASRQVGAQGWLESPACSEDHLAWLRGLTNASPNQDTSIKPKAGPQLSGCQDS